MKARIQDFIEHLIVYDYLLFGGVFILFILLLILAIVLRQKMGLAIFFVLSAFGVLTAGPIVGYLALHQYLFQHTLIIQEIKALEFTEALLVKGEIRNTSKRPFSECTIHAGVYKVTHNQYLDRAYPYLPFKKSALKIDETIGQGEAVPFKLFIEPFRYTKDYNVSLKGECR